MTSTFDPYHPGEHALQQRTGVRARMSLVGEMMIRDRMPEQHRELFAKLPFVLAGHLDAQGCPEATALAGPPGFVHAPDERRLTITAPPPSGLRPGAAIGLLGIEPHTRRRNRMNGIVEAAAPLGFSVQVRQSFGSCPKYIQARRAQWVGSPTPGPTLESGPRLDDAARCLIDHADTFFIASSCPPELLDSTPAHGVDVSHRGGKPGFVKIATGADGGDTLTVPDFSGNSAFNTLGNLALYPHAGLLFVDFEHGHMLQLAVDTQIEWEGADLASFTGAERLVRCTVRGQRWSAHALGLAWGDAAWAAQLHATGAWPRC